MIKAKKTQMVRRVKLASLTPFLQEYPYDYRMSTIATA